MLLIYSLQITSRLQYIADLIFRDLLETDVEFTTSTDKFYNYKGPKINYSKERLGDEIHIYPQHILFEKDIKPQRVDTSHYKGMPTIFSHEFPSDLPYDPLAASFFLVTRYEEYLPFKGDRYGRFRAERSLAYSKLFHNIPVVNHYARHVKELLQQRYEGMLFSSKEYQFILTYDIDIAFKYLDRPAWRSVGSLALAVLKRNWKFISERRKVLAGVEPDPNDTFDEQLKLSTKYRIYPVYFFPTGNYGGLDKNISWKSARLKQVIRKISERFLIGLHPSYSSNKNPSKLEMEIARLNAISGKAILRSRQHYLKLEMPNTYRTLLSQSIQEDWTMGYASVLGFRASIASPYYFYDLRKEEQTNLRIYPFAAIDSALFYYLKLSSASAFEEVKLLVDEVKKVNGTFIFVAHNDLIGPHGPWANWQTYFEKLVAYARE